MSLVPRTSVSVRAAGSAEEVRPRAALVCGPRGLSGRKALAEAFDLASLTPRDAPRRLRDGRADVVVIDGGLPAETVTAILEPLALMAETERPAVVLVARRARAAGIPVERQSVVDEFVSAGQGGAVLVERVRAALRVRGWMNELGRKNAELQRLYQRLEVLADRMAEELRLASNVQRSLLPPPVQHARLEVAREFLPFREIGGDYYDFVPIGPHKLVFAIGDVMGKGVPAALLAANLKASVRAQVEGGDLCPEALVAKVNRMFWDVVPNGLFSSLFYAVFDLEAGTLGYVNAGHHHPFVVHADGTMEDLVAGGTVLGLVEDSRYEAGSITLHKDDLFVFYSDGLTDRMDGTGELFGVERLKEAALRSRHDAARITLYSLLGEVQGWAGGAPAEDDMTLVVAKAR